MCGCGHPCRQRNRAKDAEREGGRGRAGVRLHLTDQGQRTLADLLGARRQTLIEVLEPAERAQLADLAGKMLAARTTGRSALDRICRLCERSACTRCPVGGTMDNLLASAPDGEQPGRHSAHSGRG
jgi:hypothetical protein